MAATFEVKCGCPETKTITESDLQEASKRCEDCKTLPEAKIVLTYDKPWEKK